MFIVEIDEGIWLAQWAGDPERTLVKENAKKYKTMRAARIALGIAAKKYKWRGLELTARIHEIKPDS